MQRFQPARSISLRRLPKSIGLMSSAGGAPFARLAPGLRVAIGGDHNDRYIRARPRALGKSSRPLIPGMLMSDRIKISDDTVARRYRPAPPRPIGQTPW